MADGVLTFDKMSQTEFAVYSFTYPISLIPGYQDLVDVDDGLQEQIDEIIAGTAGVISFNERIGHVVPESGDYSASQVGADPAGSAAAVQSNLSAHLADLADPHDTLDALQLFIGSNTVPQQDTDTAITVINGPRIPLNLGIIQSYQALDIIAFHIELPDVLGAAGNTEVLFELIFDEGLVSEIVVASEQNRIGNTQGPVNFDVKGIANGSVGPGTIALYGTAVSGNTTVDGSIRENYLLAERTRNFSFKAYAP